MAAATSTPHTWVRGDSLARVASRHLENSGYSDTSTLMEAIRNYNPEIGNYPPWHRVPVDTILTIPYQGR